MTFNSLGLSDALLKAISKKGHTHPTPIQQKVIPRILDKKDVLASAQTGTGKTAGFALPILHMLDQGPVQRNRHIRCLILTPTRELAAQVQEEVSSFSIATDIRSAVIFGGVNANTQIRRLRQGIDILVATPGRLLDLENQGALALDKVEYLVLDEADRMLDMGFLRDIKRILALLPKKRQNLLFSATFSKEIKTLASSFMHDAVQVDASPQNSTAEGVNQKIYHTDKSRKTELVTKLIDDGNWQQVLVFTRTKHGANKLSKKLDHAGIRSAAIHGNKSQGARTKALSGFKAGHVRVLVATDIAARGLDIPLLPHVINFELPNIPEDYVHRIGRTGRAGAEGEAISIVSVDEKEYVAGIEKLLDERLPQEVIPGFEPTETLQELQSVKDSNRSQHRNGQNRNGNNRSERSSSNNRNRRRR